MPPWFDEFLICTSIVGGSYRMLTCYMLINAWSFRSIPYPAPMHRHYRQVVLRC